MGKIVLSYLLLIFFLVTSLSLLASEKDYYLDVLQYGTDSDIVKAFSKVHEDLGAIVNAKVIDILQIMLELEDIKTSIQNRSILLSDLDKKFIIDNDFDTFWTKMKLGNKDMLTNRTRSFVDLNCPRIYRPDYTTNPRAKAQQGQSGKRAF